MTTFQDPFGILQLIAQAQHLNVYDEELEGLPENEKSPPQLWLLDDNRSSALDHLRL